MSQPLTTNPSRRRLLTAFGTFCIWPAARAAPRAPIAIEIWKSPTCGCCKDWIAHLEANGFRASVHDDGNTDIRERLGVGIRYGSCHTARVGGYAIEGHVPAREIHRLLDDRPIAVGLAVPAMPLGAPGMDGPQYAGRKDAYDVFLLRAGGGATVYQAYR